MARKNPIAHLDQGDVAKLNAALRSLGDRASGLALLRAAEDGADAIAAEIKGRAPVDQGDLQDSISTQVHRVQSGRAQVDIGPSKAEAFVASLNEFGTEKMGASPFVRPGFEAAQEEAVEAVRDNLRKTLRLS